MSNSPTHTPRIAQLAELIENDINSKGLKPGDPYLNATETARMLRVSTTTANRALQLLSQRSVLERRQRKGTFIAEPTEAFRRSPLGRVRLLVHQSYLKTEGLTSDGMIVGMQEALPGVEVQFNFWPATDEVDYVNRLVGEAMRSSQTEGFVLVRSSLEAQRLIHASGLPAVISGMPQPSVRGMAWIDRDYTSVGRLLAEHLLRNGFRRIVVLMREHLFPGDYKVLDAIREVLEASGVPGGVTLRCLPADRKAIKASVLDILNESTEPIGFLCRSQPWAEGAADAAEELGRNIGSEVGIVVSDVYRKPTDSKLQYPYTRPLLRPEEIGAHLGRMLAAQARGETFSPAYEIIPVILEHPKAY